MKLPDLPEEKQEPEPKPDENPKAEEPPKRKPKFGIYRGATINQPVKTGKKPASMMGGQSASRQTPRILAQAAPVPTPDDLAEIPPEPVTMAETQPVQVIPDASQGVPAGPGLDGNPGRRLAAFEAASKTSPPAKIPWKYRAHPGLERTHRAFWDVASTISLIVNVILVGLLLVMALQVRSLKTTVNNLLGGLYSNFVKLDQATINTTITVNAQIPLNFSLPVSQNTAVVLTSNVVIQSPRVAINTGGLNINAPASVTLPAGTSLPIALNLAIPVQSTIPISLQVPVSIPMSQTELHEPFTGLQTTLHPLTCIFDKNAQYPSGTFICAEHDAPTPIPTTGTP